MTFDEWWHQNSPHTDCDAGDAEAIWIAAAMNEREACARLADAHFIYGHSIAGPHFAAALADKIRMRSNDKAQPDAQGSSRGSAGAAG